MSELKLRILLLFYDRPLMYSSVMKNNNIASFTTSLSMFMLYRFTSLNILVQNSVNQ